jgi:3-hydroxyacyl-CoA dehydrogenase
MDKQGKHDRRFRRAAVLGAGVMGSGIAAHLAGAGLDVLLLDIVPPDLAPAAVGDKRARNRFAQGGVDRLRTSKPSLIFHPRDLERIRIGNLEDDLAEAAKADIVIEAVREDLTVKQALFSKIEPLLGPQTVLASNTSGLPIGKLMAGRSLDMRRRFLVTHFFNPVRYMRLLELVSGEDTDPQVMCQLAGFGETQLGKGIVYGKDTTNFVANRIGIYGMMGLISEALAAGFTVEEVDAIFGSPLGRPKSAVFRTADMVGLDTVIDVAQNCYDNLIHDESRQTFATPEVIREMVRRGYKGDKTGKGFYQKTKEGCSSSISTPSSTGRSKKVRFESLGRRQEPDRDRRSHQVGAIGHGSRQLSWPGRRPPCSFRTRHAGLDRAAKSMATSRTHRSPTICSRSIAPCAGATAGKWVRSRCGTPSVSKPASSGWKKAASSPASGSTTCSAPVARRFTAASRARSTTSTCNRSTKWPLPKSPRELPLAGLASQGLVIDKNDGARLLDLHDDVYALEFQTKMNSIDGDVIGLINKAIEICDARKKAAWSSPTKSTDAFSAGRQLDADRDGGDAGQLDDA